MPNAITAFATWVVKAVTTLGSTTTAFKVAVAAVELATYAAITFATTKLLGKDAIGTDSSRSVTTRGTVEAQKLIYGETVVSGPIAYVNCGGIQNRDLYHVIALAGHECEEISDIYLGNTAVLEANINSGAAAGGAVTSGDFGPVAGNDVLAVYKYLGTSSQTANSQLVSAFTEWTSAHRGRGIAYIATVFSLWDRTDALWREHSGKNIRAKVKGKKDIYDPRLDTSAGANPGNSSYQAWSDNPALCAANYMTDTRFGMGIDTSRIDWDAVVTAANVCDALVSIPGSTTEKRFTCNGVIYSNKSHKVNVKQILSSMNGTMIYAAGKYVISAGAYEAPTITLTDDDFAGNSLTIVTSASRSDRFNQIKGQFFDKADNYTPKEFPTVDPGTYVTRDNGQELPRSITLNMTDSLYMAQRIGWKLLAQQNQQLVISANFNYSALQLAVGDRVNLSVAEMGWSPKIFQVLSMRMLQGEDYAVQMELREDASTAYADPAVSDYVQQTSEGALTENVPGVPAPSGLAATSQMNGIRLTWTLPTDDAVYDAFEVWASANNAWASAERVATTLGNTWFHPLAANTTRYYWVRAVLDGQFLSDRNPNSDTSTISATAGIDDATRNTGALADRDTVDLGTTGAGGVSGTLPIGNAATGLRNPASGTNLVQIGTDTFSTSFNSTFLNGRMSYGGGAGSYSFSTSVADIPFDGQALQFISDGTNDYVFWASGPSSADYNLPIKNSQKYIVSMWCRFTGIPSSYFQARLRLQDGDYATSAFDLTGVSVDTWNRLSTVIETPSDATDANLSVWCNSSSGLSVYIDGVMLEEYNGDETSPNASTFVRAGDPSLYGADWNATVNNRPTELTDGRVSAGLDSSGDLNRNISIARANSSNILRYSGGGNFTGDLASTRNTGALADLDQIDLAETGNGGVSGMLPAGYGGTGITNFSNSTHLNANTSASDVGLGNVDNNSTSTILGMTHTGPVSGNVTGTVNGVSAATVQAGAADGAQQQAQASLLPQADDSEWSLGEVTTAGKGIWTRNGDGGDENTIVLEEGPHGDVVRVWKSISTDGSGADGGFSNGVSSSDYFAINSDVVYRFSCFVKQSQADGTMYFGARNWNSSGSNVALTWYDGDGSTTNPYWYSGDLDSFDDWYLLVGHINPSGSSINSGKSGLYRVSTGEKTTSFEDFRFNASAATFQVRTYLFYSSTDSGTIARWAHPRVDRLDRAYPSIQQLIAGAENSLNSSINVSLVVDQISVVWVTSDSGSSYIPSSTTQDIVVSAVSNGSESMTVRWTRSSGNISGCAEQSGSTSAFTLSSFGSAAASKTITVTHTASGETIDITASVTDLSVSGGGK